MTDLATIWREEAAGRAQRANAAVATGAATQAMADADAHLCALVARYLIPAADFHTIMATSASLVDQLTDAAVVLLRIARSRAELSASAQWARVTLDDVRADIWAARRWIDRSLPAHPPHDWRCAS